MLHNSHVVYSPLANKNYHTSNSPPNVWESMGKPCSCTQFIKSLFFYYKSCKNPYQVLQVTCATSERCNEIKDSFDQVQAILESFVAVGIVTLGVYVTQYLYCVQFSS